MAKSTRILLSYIKARLLPIKPERSYEDWVVNRFGRVLFDTFFKSYTEKVWGMPTNAISADWAAQRIKGLSLVEAVLSAFKKPGKGEVVKTLIEEFHYPRLGPGQMWEAARDKIRGLGGAVHMDRRVVRIDHDGSSVTSVLARDASGKLRLDALARPEFDAYQGVLGHFHVQTNKTDPGPAFQWDLLIDGARSQMGLK